MPVILNDCGRVWQVRPGLPMRSRRVAGLDSHVGTPCRGEITSITMAPGAFFSGDVEEYEFQEARRSALKERADNGSEPSRRTSGWGSGLAIHTGPLPDGRGSEYYGVPSYIL